MSQGSSIQSAYILNLYRIERFRIWYDLGPSFLADVSDDVSDLLAASPPVEAPPPAQPPQLDGFGLRRPGPERRVCRRHGIGGFRGRPERRRRLARSGQRQAEER